MIYRTYECLDCNARFEVTCESSAGDPDCPNCARVLDWRPGSFAITGTKSKAIDTTQKILEQDFGLSNFKDNQREGDTAAIVPAAPGAVARDAEIRQLSEVAQAKGTPMTPEQHNMATQFWGGGAMQKTLPAETLLAGARASTAAANAEGLNPMQLLHSAGKAGKLKTKIDVVARAN